MNEKERKQLEEVKSRLGEIKDENSKARGPMSPQVFHSGECHRMTACESLKHWIADLRCQADGLESLLSCVRDLSPSAEEALWSLLFKARR